MADNKRQLPSPPADTHKNRRAILGQIKSFDLAPLEEDNDTYISLEESLRQHGCINPIVMHRQEVISGRARKAICDTHGVKYEIVQVDDLDEVEVISLQNDLTFVGRQIDTATKKKYAKHLLLASNGELSNRAVGSMAALDPKTIQVIRDELEASVEIPHTTIRYSRDGRSQDVSDKEDCKIETDKSGPEDDDWLQDESDHEPESEIEESDDEDEDKSSDQDEFDDGLSGPCPQLVSFDGPSPEELPKHVYEVSKGKLTIVRHKVDRQAGDKYILGNGRSLPKCFGHPTWMKAHESLLAAVEGDRQAAVDGIKDLSEQRTTLIAQLKNVEVQIATAKKERKNLDQRLGKVKKLVPPKCAEAETVEVAA